MTVADAIDTALKHHEAGQLASAEPLYRAVLAQNPTHSVALHLLGVLSHQAGKTAEGIALVERALAVRRDPAFLANLGELLRSAGEIERGIACCQEAIKLSPGLPAAYHNLAASLDQVNRSDEALLAARRGDGTGAQ